MFHRDITSQVMVNVYLTNIFNIQTGAQGFPFSMFLFVFSATSLINMIKADKIIAGHITNYVCLVKAQSYAGHKMIIIACLKKLNMSITYEVYEWHTKAFEAAISLEKT